MGFADALGLKVAPAAQRRKAAWIMLAVTLVLGGGAIGAFVGPYAWRHYTYMPAEARVTHLETLCHYQIKRFNKRGPAQVTGLVDCAAAEAEAARIDHAMGEIRRVAVVGVSFSTAEGGLVSASFEVPVAAVADVVLGQSLAIQYDPERPYQVQRLADHPFALAAENRYAGAAAIATQAKEEQARKVREARKPVEPGSTLYQVSSVIAWIIIALMGLAILWVIRALWRLARRLLGTVLTAPAVRPTARVLGRGTPPTDRRRSRI